ncbi:MAG TPA: hypothetical protein VMX35_06700, partial [Acidobacteriota bacterium]|nr:hypothetical protein [Acidobacteriota bacterium]
DPLVQLADGLECFECLLVDGIWIREWREEDRAFKAIRRQKSREVNRLPLSLYQSFVTVPRIIRAGKADIPHS